MTTRMRAIGSMTVLVTALALAGCSTANAQGPVGTATVASQGGTATAPTGTITVFAAASLQKTFTAIGERFEREHPGTRIAFSFGGSSDLVSQIQNGAPADVFASADEKNMDKVVSAGLVHGTPTDFASNVLEIAVAPGNPKHVTSLRDLTAPGIQLVTCAAPVPCGAATAKVEQASGVDLRPVSEEQSVTDVLGKVESGQADAGLVYVTDVEGAAGKVDGVRFAESAKAVNTYPIAVLGASRDRALAEAFAGAVSSADGQATLRAAGFGKP